MTDFKTKMAELAAKYNIPHKRDIDWHNFVYEVQQLKEDELKNVDKLRAISTPAEEDWFEIAEGWEKEDDASEH